MLVFVQIWPFVQTESPRKKPICDVIGGTNASLRSVVPGRSSVGPDLEEHFDFAFFQTAEDPYQ